MGTVDHLHIGSGPAVIGWAQSGACHPPGPIKEDTSIVNDHSSSSRTLRYDEDVDRTFNDVEYLECSSRHCVRLRSDLSDGGGGGWWWWRGFDKAEQTTPKSSRERFLYIDS